MAGIIYYVPKEELITIIQKLHSGVKQSMVHSFLMKIIPFSHKDIWIQTGKTQSQLLVMLTLLKLLMGNGMRSFLDADHTKEATITQAGRLSWRLLAGSMNGL